MVDLRNEPKRSRLEKTEKALILAGHENGRSFRSIARIVGRDRQTVANYLRRPDLDDPEIQEMVAQLKKLERDDLDQLILKGRARLHEYLDQEKVQPIPVLAIVDRSFSQREIISTRPAHLSGQELYEFVKDVDRKLAEMREHRAAIEAGFLRMETEKELKK